MSVSTVHAWSRDSDYRDRKGCSAATRARQAGRVAPSRVHELAERWEGKAPDELLAELRGLIDGWEPVERPADRRRDGSTSVAPDLVERVAREDRGRGVRRGDR